MIGSCKKIKAMCAGLVMLTVFSALPVFGSTITVTNTNDSGAGSLRDAIASALDGDTINFSLTALPAIITLTGGQLSINKNLTISGPGASNLAISGNGVSRVFNIGSGVTVAISGLTIENGSAGTSGGGIENFGTLTVTNCTLSGNRSVGGGGGIENSGTLTVTDSTLSGNIVAPVLVPRAAGGGIENSGTLTVTDSTLSGNFAPGGGGGIDNTTIGTASVTNSTLSGNSTEANNADIGGGGGGIENFGQLTVTNSTLSGNSASGGNGGIADAGFSQLKNTIVANNGANCAGFSHPFSLGHNLSDDTTCFGQIGDLNNTAAGLDPGGLKNNGGPTPTIALLPTSPAVNAIPVTPTNYCTEADGTTPIATDQRGVTRPQGSACDIGAFELVPLPITLTSSLNPASAGDSVTFTATVASSSGLVTFLEGASMLGTQTLSSNQAALTIEDADSLGVGSFPITASFGGGTATLMQTVTLGGVAQTNSNNSFTGNQTISGTLSATSLIGNGSGLLSLNPASLSPGTAGINVTGTANNALNLGGLPPSAYQPAGPYATTGANTFTDDQTITGNLTTTGLFSGAFGSFTGTLTTRGTSLPALGTATAAQGFFSSPLDLFASSFSSSSGAVNQRFRWQAEPAGNNSANPSGRLNLLFASGGGSPAETGFSIDGSGHITFAPGQAFPGTGTATSLNCSGCVGNTQLGVNYAGSATQGGPATSALVANLATNASALGGVGPSGYAPATGSTVYVAKAGDTMTGDLNLPNLNASGKVSANGSLVVGSGGTAITEHLSMTFSPSFAALKPSTCTHLAFTFPGASDGDTIALGVPNAMMTVAGIPNYFAWVSAANTITIRACNLDPNINQKTGASGTVRIDVTKH